MERLRRGFTMVELLFVIVILGIVGGITMEAIRQYYEGVFRSTLYTQRVNEANHILEQVSKYFENAIDLSIVNLDPRAIGVPDGVLNGANCSEPGVEVENNASDYTVAFVGVDVESLRTVGKAGWSEVVTLNPAGTLLTSLDANFSAADASIQALYPASDLNHSVIYNFEDIVGSCSNFNWDNAGNLNGYYSITNVAGNTLSLTNNAGRTGPINDKKYLLSSGYAFRVMDTGEFVMFSNFRPWRSELYTGGKRSTLGRNVASFYADFNNTNSYNSRGSVWKLKVCMKGLDANLTSSDVAGEAICRERSIHVRY
jgi:prepilin-type N-terminal cleavage/methylation domain-containing protein